MENNFWVRLSATGGKDWEVGFSSRKLACWSLFKSNRNKFPAMKRFIAKLFAMSVILVCLGTVAGMCGLAFCLIWLSILGGLSVLVRGIGWVWKNL